MEVGVEGQRKSEIADGSVASRRCERLGYVQIRGPSDAENWSCWRLEAGDEEVEVAVEVAEGGGVRLRMQDEEGVGRVKVLEVVMQTKASRLVKGRSLKPRDGRTGGRIGNGLNGGSILDSLFWVQCRVVVVNWMGAWWSDHRLLVGDRLGPGLGSPS